MRCDRLTVALTVCTLLLVVPVTTGAQTPRDTLVVAAGAHYEAGGLKRFFNGTNWREVWTQPVRVPVLDLGTFAGGLTPERRGGGAQSTTLHMRDATGRRWIFRSIDKDPERGLPDEVRGTPAGAIVRDHISTLHPGGHFLMPPLLEAVGLLHVQPRLYIMPSDARLGEFREEFAGMLGELEIRPDEGPDNTPGFAGSRSVKGSEEFFEDLEESQRHRLDERELLRARLIDFLVGDPDRGTDQWRWARFEQGDVYVWRPVPIDRDWALTTADGALVRVARSFYPKLTQFRPRYPSIETLTYSSHIVDRRLLTRLVRQDFIAEAERVRTAITDDVIARAVAAMPPEYAALTGERITTTLQARRAQLTEIALAFYAWLASDVDVRGTDENDLLEMERRGDGTVLVRISPRRDGGAAATSASPGALYYERVFDPAETREIRVYLHGGDDHARISGAADGPIVLRVIGGGGQDLLEDRAGNVRFYDDRGAEVIAAGGTRFDERPWRAPRPPEGLRTDIDWVPDWGGSSGFGPAVDYSGRHGVFGGVSATTRRYGFRRAPHHWELSAAALFAPLTSAARLEVEYDYRLQNSPRSVIVEGVAWRRDLFRFYGFGNSTTDAAERDATVYYDHVRVTPALQWRIGPRPGRAAEAEPDTAAEEQSRWLALRPVEGFVRVGPSAGWTRMRGSDDVTQLGGRMMLELRRTDVRRMPRRGVRVEAEAEGYPVVDGVEEGFGRAAVDVTAYLSLPGVRPYLALRTGGERAFGDGFPAWNAAFLGGRHDVRGLRTDRYAGDTSAHGSAELRLPLDSVTLLLRTELGLFGFADAGRVWYRGDSPGGWHTAAGGGVWLSAFGRALSAAVARGETTRVHFWFGLPF